MIEEPGKALSESSDFLAELSEIDFSSLSPEEQAAYLVAVELADEARDAAISQILGVDVDE